MRAATLGSLPLTALRIGLELLEGAILVVDEALARLLTRRGLTRGPTPRSPCRSMNVVVFCPNFIGDTVMATPAFRALRRGLAGATKILVVVKPQVALPRLMAPWFDDLIRFDPERGGPGSADLLGGLPTATGRACGPGGAFSQFLGGARSCWRCWPASHGGSAMTAPAGASC